jgi:Methane oxygenase PmoA
MIRDLASAIGYRWRIIMTGSYRFPRVQVIPQLGRASLAIDGIERVGYQFGEDTSRPFLFPLVGPSGAILTRLGHPNPIGHEHHKSIWFGHGSVGGINFWEERPNTDIRIRHRSVRLYHDGSNWGGMVAELDWWAHGRSVLRQELTIVLEPSPYNGYALDLQSRFDSPDGNPVEFGPTNLGFLGVRVAKTMSEQFGGGRLTDARGSRGEAVIVGGASQWVDYSGPSAPGKIEGICLMNHPSNPNSPSYWHVRGDGCMGASFNLQSNYGVARDHSLCLRYRLVVHSGHAEPEVLNPAWESFANTPAYVIASPGPNELAALARGETTTGTRFGL